MHPLPWGRRHETWEVYAEVEGVFRKILWLVDTGIGTVARDWTELNMRTLEDVVSKVQWPFAAWTAWFDECIWNLLRQSELGLEKKIPDRAFRNGVRLLGARSRDTEGAASPAGQVDLLTGQGELRGCFRTLGWLKGDPRLFLEPTYKTSGQPNTLIYNEDNTSWHYIASQEYSLLYICKAISVAMTSISWC